MDYFSWIFYHSIVSMVIYSLYLIVILFPSWLILFYLSFFFRRVLRARRG
jgi:hypothetical protein